MGRKIHIDPRLPVLLAAALLLVPFKWFVAWLLAVSVHESCHIAALRAYGVDVVSLELGLQGACIRTPPLMNGEELICAAAGLAGSLILCLFHKIFPQLALCGFVHLLFNLLPIFPFDGGRVLRCGLCLVFGQQITQNILKIIGTLVCALLLILALIGLCCYNLGPLPIACAYIAVHNYRKIPCKWP